MLFCEAHGRRPGIGHPLRTPRIVCSDTESCVPILHCGRSCKTRCNGSKTARSSLQSLTRPNFAAACSSSSQNCARRNASPTFPRSPDSHRPVGSKDLPQPAQPSGIRGAGHTTRSQRALLTRPTQTGSMPSESNFSINGLMAVWMSDLACYRQLTIRGKSESVVLRTGAFLKLSRRAPSHVYAVMGFSK